MKAEIRLCFELINAILNISSLKFKNTKYQIFKWDFLICRDYQIKNCSLPNCMKLNLFGQKFSFHIVYFLWHSADSCRILYRIVNSWYCVQNIFLQAVKFLYRFAKIHWNGFWVVWRLKNTFLSIQYLLASCRSLLLMQKDQN
jgi:hypothetical protein